MISIQQQYQ